LVKQSEYLNLIQRVTSQPGPGPARLVPGLARNQKNWNQEQS
jgi:hypothetical protein